MKKHIYADRQILAQHDGDTSDDRYFYLHDRLGSVRLVIDDEGGVQNYYTYEPFGEVIDSGGSFDNSFMFTGQYFDSEIEEYYLRARSPWDIPPFGHAVQPPPHPTELRLNPSSPVVR